jgi:hypothetical protein
MTKCKDQDLRELSNILEKIEDGKDGLGWQDLEVGARENWYCQVELSNCLDADDTAWAKCVAAV